MFLRTNKNKGFTLVELMVSIGIFVFMTVLMIVKYGNFNQSVLLTNLAYDIALTIRTAQTYGLSVQGQTPNTSQNFQVAYGVRFDTASANNKKFIFFADNNNGVYGLNDYDVSTYNIKRGAKISQICMKEDCSTTANFVDISFMRPNPDAVICADGSCSTPLAPYVKITVKATDGSTRNIVVRKTGQVSVEN